MSRIRANYEFAEVGPASASIVRRRERPSLQPRRWTSIGAAMSRRAAVLVGSRSRAGRTRVRPEPTAGPRPLR
ncbi:MAG: hypothetical protein MZU84_03960 [Sphingobacterium sp.]|nr:hypothetical protein [Sphingobacterium sp.]